MTFPRKPERSVRNLAAHRRGQFRPRQSNRKWFPRALWFARENARPRATHARIWPTGRSFSSLCILSWWCIKETYSRSASWPCCGASATWSVSYRSGFETDEATVAVSAQDSDENQAVAKIVVR